MSTTLENSEQQRPLPPGSPDTGTPPETPPNALSAAASGPTTDNTAYPDDHEIDDPALLEAPRSQREVDLEALDYHLAGYSVRQIAKLQDVHPNTAFNRIKRGRAIDAREPLRAEGQSLHAQVAKLRQLERAFLPLAAAGDLRAAQFVIRVMDKLVRLGKFEHDQKEAEELRKLRESPIQPGARDGARKYDDPDDMFSWDFLAEMLPQRKSEIAALKRELATAEAVEEQQLRARMKPAQAARPATVGQTFLSAIPIAAPPADLPRKPEPASAPRRPLTRKERKLAARAQREEARCSGANSARAQREQGANSGASATATNIAKHVDTGTPESAIGATPLRR